MADAPDAPQLNEKVHNFQFASFGVDISKAGTLFRNGRYEEEAKTYEDAVVADNGKSAVYRDYSNLAAAHLKLQRTDSPNSVLKIAKLDSNWPRMQLTTHLCEIVDQRSILATEPAHREARAAFVESMRMHDSAGKPSLSVAEIRRMDFPPAHGSALTAPASPDNRPSVSLNQAQRPSRASKDTKVPCNGCHSKFLNPVEAIYCLKCGTSPYCNEACRRVNG
ncbi:hypothetical protein FB451DRAFT_1404123 [Mycena latifolia]|nr:hypothetical protein FB451DRAFT_1404123 [Mycena latifolia]